MSFVVNIDNKKKDLEVNKIYRCFSNIWGTQRQQLSTCRLKTGWHYFLKHDFSSYLWYFFQWWHKVNITHNGQRMKHVDCLWNTGDTWLVPWPIHVCLFVTCNKIKLLLFQLVANTHTENVKEYRSVSPLLQSEDVFGKITDGWRRDGQRAILMVYDHNNKWIHWLIVSFELWGEP